MKAELICSLTVVCLLAAVCATQKEATFSEVKNARGKTFTTTFIRELTNILSEDCALLCLITNICYSFFSDHSNGLCRLIAGHLSESQMTQSTSATISYYKKGGSVPTFCPVDFDDLYMPTVCFKKVDLPGLDHRTTIDLCANYSGANFVGHLMSVRTIGMYNRVDALISRGSYHVDGFKRLPDETWVDWKGDEFGFTRWGTGEPNNWYSPDPTREQCVVIMSKTAKLHDIPCVGHPSKTGFFCQISLQ